MSNKIKRKPLKASSTPIAREMKQKFGFIPHGGEDPYNMFFFTIESNAAKVHRSDSEANSSAFRSALLLSLQYIKFRLGEGEPIDYSTVSEPVQKLLQAILYAFDPFTCNQIREVLDVRDIDLSVPETAMIYYQIPVMCILRLLDSVDTWQEMLGKDGYFKGIEQNFGSMIEHDMKMNFIMPVSSQTMI